MTDETERKAMFEKFNDALSDFINDYIQENEINQGVMLNSFLHHSLYALCKDQCLDDIRKNIQGILKAFMDVLSQLSQSEEKEIGYDWFGFITNEIHLKHKMISPEESDR